MGLLRAPHQKPLEDRFDHLLRVHRHGDRNTEGFLDAAVLVDEDVEDDAVDAVVLPIEESNLDGGLLLPVAIDPPFPLLMPRRIPGEVVVNDGVERFLEVDAFGKAIGGHEEPAVVLGELLDPLLALGRRQRAGDAVDLRSLLPPESFAESRSDVLGGGNVATEDDRIAAPLEHLFEELHKRGELGVAGPLESGRPGGERPQPLPVRRGGGIVHLGPSRRIVWLVGVVSVAVHGRGSAQLVHLFFGGARQAAGPVGERGGGCGRARGEAAKEGNGTPPAHPLPAFVFPSDAHKLTGKLEAIVEERFFLWGELVGVVLLKLADGEGGVGVEVGLDVLPPALNEKAGEPTAIGLVLRAREVFGKVCERLVEKADERSECALVAAVGGGGDKDQVTGRVRGQPREELVPLVPRPAGGRVASAGVGLVDDHQLRTGAEKLGPVPLALDEVDRDDRMVVELENRLIGDALPLEPGHGAREDELGVDVELARQFLLPLLGQVRRAKDHQPPGLSACQELGRDQAGLDRLADADVVRDEHSGLRLLECDQERHELVGPRGHGDAAKRPEGAGATANAETDRIAEQ